MPGIDGLRLAQLLQNKLVIFTTAYKDYAVDAFEIDAVDYITKPVKKERLHKAVVKALERLNQNSGLPKFIPLNSDKGKIVLYFHQIVLVKSAANDSRDKEVLLQDGSVIILKNINFETLLSQLPPADFCRINKKEIVAMKAVKFFNHNEIALQQLDKNGRNTAVVLSETYRSDFLLKVKI
jgi:DNA-binding LytR/AlgR family response regulator